MNSKTQSNILKAVLFVLCVACSWLGQTWALTPEKTASLVLLMLLVGFSMAQEGLSFVTGAAYLLMASVPFLSAAGAMITFLAVESIIIYNYIKDGGDRFSPGVWASSWILIVSGYWLQKTFVEADLAFCIFLFLRASQWPFKNAAEDNQTLSFSQRLLLMVWVPLISIFTNSFHVYETKIITMMILALISAMGGRSENVATVALGGWAITNPSIRSILPALTALFWGGFWGRVIAMIFAVSVSVMMGGKDSETNAIVTAALFFIALRAGEGRRDIQKQPTQQQLVHIIVGVVFAMFGAYHILAQAPFSEMQNGLNSIQAIMLTGGLTAIVWHLLLLKWPSLGLGIRSIDLHTRVLNTTKKWKWSEQFVTREPRDDLHINVPSMARVFNLRLSLVSALALAAIFILIVGGLLL